MRRSMADQSAMNKPNRSRARPLSALLGKTLNDAFAKQGFASTELVTRWNEIVGPEIAAHSQPEKIQWPRPFEGQPSEPGTLLLRVEGPAAIEVQHLSAVILERVNRFFGWQAIGGLRLRQAPLRREHPQARFRPRIPRRRPPSRRLCPGSRTKTCVRRSGGWAPPSNRRESRGLLPTGAPLPQLLSLNGGVFRRSLLRPLDWACRVGPIP